MYLSRQQSAFMGKMMVTTAVQIQISMGGFMIHFSSQGSITSKVNINIQGGRLHILFNLHHKLNALMYALLKTQKFF